MMTKILICGGTGLLGSAISRDLCARGLEVGLLSRRPGKMAGRGVFQWWPENRFIELAALDGVEHVIQLAGAGIFDQRWSASYKHTILRSRVHSSHFIFESLKSHGIMIKSFTGVSAAGYYGQGISWEPHSETSPPGSGFLAEVCQDWEKSYRKFSDCGVRTCVIRLPVVLSNEAGIFPRLKKFAGAGLLTLLGSGKQPFPFIHIEDAARFFAETVINNSLSGVYNLCADEQVSQRGLTESMKRFYGNTFSLPPLPGFILTLALGERAKLLTEGRALSNKKLRDTGFRLQYPRLDDALSGLLA